MSKALITTQYLTDIANAIREKLAVATRYLPSQMAEAIRSIQGAPSEWQGTQEAYDALGSYDQNTTYYIFSPLQSILITHQPTKTSYAVNDVLDLRGIEVMATHGDGSTSNVTNYCTYSPASGYKLQTAGTVTVTVSLTDCGITVTATTSGTVEA